MIGSASHSPQGFNQEDLLQLQGMVGNRSVGRLMGKPPGIPTNTAPAEETTSVLQLAPEETGQKAGGQDPMAEIDAILAKIPSPPRVPAYEAITSTTGGEYSYLHWEKAMESSWRRKRLSFTAAARGLAGRQEEGRQISTKSPTIKPQVPYARRWTLNLIATNYKKGKSLAHVSNFLKKGSPFERAQAAESDRAITINDPTGETMRSQIREAVLSLFAELPSGQNGELVVYFSGHGSSGRILGVDWVKVWPEDLKAIANFARDWNVHIVYVLDTCRAGLAVAYPQAAALGEAESHFENLPEPEKKALKVQAAATRKLGRLTFKLDAKTVELSEIARYIKVYNDANRRKLLKPLHELSNEAANLRNILREGKIPAGMLKNQADLEKAIGDLTMAVLLAFPGAGKEVNAVLRAAAGLLGHLNISVNTMVEQISSKLGTRTTK